MDTDSCSQSLPNLYGENGEVPLASVLQETICCDEPSINSTNKTAEKEKRAYLSVTILCFINLINYMDRSTIAGVLLEVQNYYKIEDSEAGLLQTSFVISYMVMAPVFGFLGDRYNRKTIIACGVLFWSATTLAGSYVTAEYFMLFLFLRALVGTGEASYSTIAPTIIADLFTCSSRSTMLAIFYFAIPVGSGLGYIVGAGMAKLLGHWSWSLRITPGLGVLSVLLTIFFVSEPPRGEAEGGVKLKNTKLHHDLIALMKNKSLMWSTGGFVCVTFATGALAWWAPTYMTFASELAGENKSKTTISTIFGVITCIAGIVGVLLGSATAQWYRHYNPRADPLVCAFGVIGSCPFVFLGLVMAKNYTTLSWILIFIGETLLCMNWAIIADILLYVVIPTRRSLAEAVQILISHALGDACSPYIIGAITDSLNYGKNKTTYLRYTSLQNALYITAFVLVIGGICFFMTACYIVQDKKKCFQIMHNKPEYGSREGLLSDEDVTDDTDISVDSFKDVQKFNL